MKRMVLLVTLILLLPGVLASTSVDYQIFDEKVLVEVSSDSVSNFGLKIPSDFSALEVNRGYELLEVNGDKIIRINKASDLKISFITKSHLDKSRSKFFFVAKNSFSELVGMRLFLPEGAGLLESENFLVVPSADEILSDGRRVVLSWDNFEEEQVVVAYEFVERDSFILWILVVLLAVSVIYSLFGNRLRNRKKSEKKKIDGNTKKVRKKRELTRNLFKEERKIVEYLFDKKRNESWTKEIVNDLGISKVRLSRRLRNLEQKGLIKKTPHGNENRIKLLKK